MSKKLYKSTTGVEYMFHVPVDKKEVTVWTRESGNTFTTTDKNVQQAIENHPYFKKGLIVLAETVETTETKEVTEKDITPPADKVVTTETTETVEAVETAKTKEAEEKEIEPVQAHNEYPEVKYMSDAVELLKSPPYNVPESDLVLKKQVLDKAKKLGIKFPNYR